MRPGQAVREAEAVARQAAAAARGGWLEAAPGRWGAQERAERAEPPGRAELLYLAFCPWTLALGFALLALRAVWSEMEEATR